MPYRILSLFVFAISICRLLKKLHLTPRRSLGMHAPQEPTVSVNINAFTLTLTQSPTLLRSSLACGTTGAVVWNLTPRLARYLTSSSCPLLPPSSRILELGCGVSSVLAATLGTMVNTYIQSDMPYAVKLAEQNLRENLPARKKGKKVEYNVHTIRLNWEEDDVASHPVIRALDGALTAVIACDCVYNETLIQPFLDTVVSACLLHRINAEKEEEKTLVIVATEIRSPDVQECFLEAFMARFDVYRISSEFLPDELQPEHGIVIHIGMLRSTTT
ncbi:hypothetical protein K440DRAFT_277981 [Wilcoxina mikolae CBS 423.85]|nr:hypothetical protein K440DRAFT_277981 [Wilcoxina mikolae CBS 423.85]